MRRYGPLHASAAGVIVGDPIRRHLLLTPDDISSREDKTVQHTLAWGDVESLTLALHSTAFRYPGAASGIAQTLVGLIGMDDGGIGQRDGTCAVRLRGEEEPREWGIDQHHPGGYWRGSVRVASRLIDSLIADPARRVLLRDPYAVVAAVARAGRRGR